MKTFIKIITIIAGVVVTFIIGFFVIGLIFASTVDDIPKTSKAQVEKQDTTSKKDSIQKAEQRAQMLADSIQAAEKAAAVEKAKKQLATFKSSKDEFDGTAFFRDPRTPNYTNRNFIYPYIGNKADNYWLRLKFQYTASTWLFINQVKIKTDENQYELNGNFERDNNSQIWEWGDISAGPSEQAMLWDMANSENVLVRYVGTQYHKDRKLTKKEKSIIAKTLNIYTTLKN